MTDTNKEREMLAIPSSTVKKLRKLIMPMGNGFFGETVLEVLEETKDLQAIGDRVGQTFEEWWNDPKTDLGIIGVIHKQDGEAIWNAAVAATLQPQQTMGREELERLFIPREVFVDFLRKVVLNGEWSNDTGRMWQRFYDDRIVPLHSALLGKLPAPSHPGEGELTRFKAMLDGKSIDELYAEVAKGGEK